MTTQTRQPASEAANIRRETGRTALARPRGSGRPNPVGGFAPGLEGLGRHGRAPHQVRIFTARAATSPTVSRETNASTAINSLLLELNGMVSVGEKAVALVNDK